ncbi:alpha/beta hydrolase [Kribbella sp. NPDC051770]|uniref:alpha/beta fold hydrolase n=1 Tax=Kribbella sp. NPDC051770 TaxID=3155413 RepID=UPI0034203580
MTTHTIEVNGLTQRYHVHGTGPILVAHSGGPGINWDYLRMPVLEQHLQIVYVEPIGTGDSGRLPSHPRGYVRDRYAEQLAAVIDDLGAGPVHLLGHSHGGFVAQHFALHHTDRLAGVVLYDSAPVTGAEFGEEAGRNFTAYAARNAGNPELAEVMAAVQGIGGISNDEEFAAVARGIIPAYLADYWGLRQPEYEKLRASVGGTYVDAVEADGTPETIDDRPLLGGLDLPALVIGGRFDPICGPRWSEELANLIPGAELVLLEHSAHFGHVEEPEAFAEAVAGFVARLTSVR